VEVLTVPDVAEWRRFTACLYSFVISIISEV